MTGRLAGRGVVITGATGIAAASAHRFAAEGARVFLISRTEDHLGVLADALAEDGAEAGWAAADLADEAQAEAAMAEASSFLGRIDGLFAVAGGSGRRFGDAPVHELTAEGWDATLALNARSQVLTRFKTKVIRKSSMPTAKIVRYSIVPCGVSPRLTCTM